MWYRDGLDAGPIDKLAWSGTGNVPVDLLSSCVATRSRGLHGVTCNQFIRNIPAQRLLAGSFDGQEQTDRHDAAGSL